jgi:ferredoxin
MTPQMTLYTEERAVFGPEGLDQLIAALADRGFRVIGPTVRDGAVIYDDIAAAADLPAGWADEQTNGSYRLRQRGDKALFGYTLSAQSWKRYLHPPEARLWSAARLNGAFKVLTEEQPQQPLAFVGVRACELAAIAVQDRVFLDNGVVDTTYAARREGLFIVAVNCGQAGGTCFCASMNTGPRATAGFDLALTEVVSKSDHYFVAEVGSERGAEVLAAVTHRPATADEALAPERITAKTAARMGRSLDTGGLKELLYDNLEHPRWEQVAQRCMACANCTMVCPTCFCANIEDTTDLTGSRAERWRKWDSCFTMDFSYIHGGSVRFSARARYRQWLTHKLATWVDQFGTFGCVGCGRCITWCPVGIDLTEEARAIRETSGRMQKKEVITDADN